MDVTPLCLRLIQDTAAYSCNEISITVDRRISPLRRDIGIGINSVGINVGTDYSRIIIRII